MHYINTFIFLIIFGHVDFIPIEFKNWTCKCITREIYQFKLLRFVV